MDTYSDNFHKDPHWPTKNFCPIAPDDYCVASNLPVLEEPLHEKIQRVEQEKEQLAADLEEARLKLREQSVLIRSLRLDKDELAITLRELEASTRGSQN